MNVALLGFGFIGKVHAYGYLNLPLFYDPPPLAARITHVVTGRPETAEKARRVLGDVRAGTDWRAVVEDPAVEIVHICTPNHLHREAVLAAMRLGKHIYCDKPLVATWNEAQEIQAALGGYRGIAQMTFQNRFFPATLRAKQLVGEGRLGKILAFRAAYLHGGSADPQAPVKWKLSAAAGGGVIADLASHVLDLVEWLAGPLAALCASSSIAYAERPSADDPGLKLRVDTEDAVTILGRLACGAQGTIEATKIATGTEDELRLEIHGSTGAIRFNLMEPHFVEFYDGSLAGAPLGGLRGWNRIATGQRYSSPAGGFPSPKAATGWIRSHVACLAAFLEAVAKGRPAEPGLEQGIRVQWLMDCARRSAAESRWVDV